GDLAGPRTLEHSVDVVLSFEGDPRSGLRMLSAGKNRFGSEGEVAWFEMNGTGLREIEPSKLLRSHGTEPGAAAALPRAGRRALAVEVQALVVPTDGPPRRQVTGLDPRRFQLVAAVLDRLAEVPLSRTEAFGAASGGLRVDDPACDLAIAAALASAVSGVPPPPASAFVGEIGLTGLLRPVAGIEQRLAAARAAGVTTVIGPLPATSGSGLRIVPARRAAEAVAWCRGRGPGGRATRRGATRSKGPLTSSFDLRVRTPACYRFGSSHSCFRLRGGRVFRKGDTVVHPEHGAAVIEELKEREILGEKRKYLVLRVAYGDLTLMVPVDSTEEVGLRQVVSKNEVKKVLNVLRQDESKMAANWSRRFKNNIEKLRSGDIYQVAEVVRNLSIRERERGLSAGEKRMIAKARQILISELTFATGGTEEKAEAMIDKVLEESHQSRVLQGA